MQGQSKKAWSFIDDPILKVYISYSMQVLFAYHFRNVRENIKNSVLGNNTNIYNEIDRTGHKVQWKQLQK